MNKDTLIAAERQRYGWQGARLNVLRTPDIDSRDWLPIRELMAAQIVVLVEPAQYQRGPDQQRVVGVTYDIFTNNRLASRDFEPIARRFQLDTGALAYVYRRQVAPSTDTAISTLRYMRDYVAERPGGQLDWIALSNMSAVVTENDDRSYAAQFALDAVGDATRSLAYIGRASGNLTLSGTARLTGSQCDDVELSVALVARNNERLDRGVTLVTGTGIAELSVPLEMKDTDNVIVTARPVGTKVTECVLELGALRLS